jgi:hypothetical protein
MVNLTDEGIVQELNHARTDDRLLFVQSLTKGAGLRLRDQQSISPLNFGGEATALISHPPEPDQLPPPSGYGTFGPAPSDQPEYAVRCTEQGSGFNVELFHRSPDGSGEKIVALWRGEFVGGARDLDAARIAATAIACRQLDF